MPCIILSAYITHSLCVSTRKYGFKGAGNGQKTHLYVEVKPEPVFAELFMALVLNCAERAQVECHSLVVSFAQKEQQPPCLHCGQDERRYPDKSDEAAGGLGSPLLHDETLLRHSDVLILPYTPSEEQTFPPEVLRVLRQRHHGDETEHEG